MPISDIRYFRHKFIFLIPASAAVLLVMLVISPEYGVHRFKDDTQGDDDVSWKQDIKDEKESYQEADLYPITGGLPTENDGGGDDDEAVTLSTYPEKDGLTSPAGERSHDGTSPTEVAWSTTSPANASSARPSAETNQTKLIILWSVRPDTDNIRWWDLVRAGKDEFERCEYTDCELSRDRGRAREATIIVYRHHDPFPDWPDVRFPNQTYIHMLNERPIPGHWWLAKFDDKINLTWNYRKDADVSHHHICVEKAARSDEEYVPRVPFANKTKMIVWAVSHCKTYSKREDYAAELAKYVDIDIFGKCGPFQCSKEKANSCLDRWEREYKFHLSFENSVCPDYITEKFYRPLDHELVPIVLGGGDYKLAGPPHSYIDARDFKSPKDLAKYLHRLANNEKEYYEYFRWKQKYKIRDNFSRVCKLCEIAHNMDKWARPVHHDYYKWWMKGCENDLVDRMREEGGW